MSPQNSSRPPSSDGLAKPTPKGAEDVRQDPFTGIGKPEPLEYHLPGAWSRRIDNEHRLIYIVTEAESILAARYHC